MNNSINYFTRSVNSKWNCRANITCPLTSSLWCELAPSSLCFLLHCERWISNYNPDRQARQSARESSCETDAEIHLFGAVLALLLALCYADFCHSPWFYLYTGGRYGQITAPLVSQLIMTWQHVDSTEPAAVCCLNSTLLRLPPCPITSSPLIRNTEQLYNGGKQAWRTNRYFPH